MARWQRQLDALRYGSAPERAMLLRWYRRKDVSAWDPFGALLADEQPWVALYEVDCDLGGVATVVFPVADEAGRALERVPQESLVLVRGSTEPGDAVVVITSTDEVEPAGRPRAPGREDPRLEGSDTL